MSEVAFFCLEYALDLPIYAGGLGVLAGDLVLEAQAEDFPLVALGLFYDRPREKKIGERELSMAGFQQRPDVHIEVEVADKIIVPQVWQKDFGRAKLFLLYAREFCQEPYGPDNRAMFYQQLVLGVGGVRLLRALGIKPNIYHLNEGHTAMALLELLREQGGNFQRFCAENVVATKHTIFTGSGLHLTKLELETGLKLYWAKYQIDIEELFSLGTHPSHPQEFSTTNFLLQLAGRQSGVSVAHVKAEAKAHPGSKLIAITNGVYPGRWQTARSETDIWTSHQKAKEQLPTGDKNALTVVWARRLVSYKRPLILFDDINRLKKIGGMAVQFVIAGSVYKADPESEKVKGQIERIIGENSLSDKVIFLPEYDLDWAKKLVQAADVWLNTPEVGYEACGTSGMKAGLNGALVVSTNDGWVAEVDLSGIGWTLPEENTAKVIYDLLESELVPLYQDRDAWVDRMKKTINLIESGFTTARMLADYKEKLYLM